MTEASPSRLIVSMLAPAIAVLVSAAVPLSAQQPDTTRARPDTVARRPAFPDSVMRLTPIEVVGSIAPAAGLEVGSGVPGRLLIVPVGEMGLVRPRALTDALEQAAGMSTYDDLGSGYKLTLVSRGFLASPVVGVPQGVSVFLDGIRQNEPDGAQVNWDLLPMEHVKRIELLSGNGSLLGRNSLGGAINLISRHATDRAAGQVTFEGGTFGRLGGNAGVSGRTGRDLGYYVGGGYDREKGWREATEAHQYNLFTNIDKSGARGGLRLQLSAARSVAKTAGSLPLTLFANADSNLTAGDVEDVYSIQTALTGYRDGRRSRASFSAYYRRHRAERFNGNQIDDPDSQGDSQNDIVGGGADYRYATFIGGKQFDVRFGVDGSASNTRLQLYADSAKFGSGRTLTTSVRSPIWDVGAFVGTELFLNPVKFSAGARGDMVGIPFENILEGDTIVTQTFRRINPRAGVDVRLAPGFTVFGSWGLAFRAPSLIEVACADPAEPCALPYALGADPPVDPVTTVTYEAGASWTSGRIAVSGTVYHTDLKNEIVLLPNELPPEPGEHASTIEGFFANVAGTRRQGFEFSFRASTLAGAIAHASYTYTLATFQVTQELASPVRDEALGVENEVEPGSIMPMVPAHLAKAGLTLPVKSFRFGVEGRFTGKQYLRGDEANAFRPLNGHVVADGRIEYENGNWQVGLFVSNVLSARYAVFGTFNFNEGDPRGPTFEPFLTPSAPRQVRLTIRRLFGTPDL